MGTFVLVALFVFIAGAIYIVYIMVKDPHNTVVKYLSSWQYRMLRKIRSMYTWGQQKTPPDSYAFFLAEAEIALKESLSSKPLVESNSTRLRQAEEIDEMLKKESFVKQYFTQYASFSGMVFHSMLQDYRTGEYLTKDYSVEERLRKILPVRLVANEKAFCEFMKFVYAGWFDKETGMLITEGRTKHHIGRAIYMICKRNNIPSPDKVFAPLWEMKEKTVYDWCRRRSRDPDITERVDKEVLTILKN